MNFDEKHNKIKDLVKDDFEILEDEILTPFKDKNPLNKELLSFLASPAKRLRPLLGILFLKSAFNEINPNQFKVLAATELIHNATLIHDDVIDNAEKRRNRETINVKFDNNLAVVAGDFLLSVAMEKIIDTESTDVFKLCSSAIKSTCIGEINQYFNKFSVTSIDKYIEKSKEKTAYLFQIAVLGSLLVSEKEVSEKLKQKAFNFSQNFGIAFQIRDDLLNLLQGGNDFNSGIYTAPVIFAYEENPDILKEPNLLEAIQKTKAIEKTKDLIENYLNRAIENIDFEDNVYKKGLLELTEIFNL